MSDDIFIKHGLGSFQQPYNARQPGNGQQPNIRNTQEPNIRNQQEPNIRNRQTTSDQRLPSNQQEPNIRNNQTPITYQHRSPFTYDHRSPSSYQARQPFTYQHRSPYTYRHPFIYQHPFTYNHRSPTTYDHRSPYTYNHRSPYTYNHRSPYTYNHRSPFTYQGREPSIGNARAPHIRNKANPSIRNNQEPNIREHQSPYIANSQTPTIATTPIIFDAVDGDTDGVGPNATPVYVSSGWGPVHSNQNWDTQHFHFVSFGQAQSFAHIDFQYQTHATVAPLSPSIAGRSNQGAVEVAWLGGTAATIATEYYDWIELYDTVATPTMDDTWVWDIKYTHTISGNAINGVANQAFMSSGTYTPNQSGGGNWTNGVYKTLYTGSSSSGSYNGTNPYRRMGWHAETTSNNDGFASAISAGDNEFMIKISKSGVSASPIYTSYTKTTAHLTARRDEGELE